MNDEQLRKILDEIAVLDNSPREYVVERDGDIPLAFDGRLIGAGDFEPSFSERGSLYRRGQVCRIFKTERNNYVAALLMWSMGSQERDHYQAHVCDSPEDLVDELRDLTKRGMPDSAKSALRQAAENDSDLKVVAVERV